MPREAIKKLYYSIGEVSEETELKQYVLRYWESEFPQLSPAKNRAGNRTYREKDIDLVKFIKTLLYEKKYTIEGARQKLKELQDGGLPLTLKSMEEPASSPSQGAMEETLTSVQSAPVDSSTNTPDKEQFRKFLLELRSELQQLSELLNT